MSSRQEELERRRQERIAREKSYRRKQRKENFQVGGMVAGMGLGLVLLYLAFIAAVVFVVAIVVKAVFF